MQTDQCASDTRGVAIFEFSDAYGSTFTRIDPQTNFALRIRMFTSTRIGILNAENISSKEQIL